MAIILDYNLCFNIKYQYYLKLNKYFTIYIYDYIYILNKY